MLAPGRSQHFRIGLGVGIGFALALGLVVLMTSIGLSHMAQIHRDLSRIVRVNNTKTELAHTMEYTLRDRAVSMHTIAVMNDPFEKEEELQRFYERGMDYIRARDTLVKMGLNPAEKAAIDLINAQARESNPKALHAIDLAMSGESNSAAARDAVRNIAVPAQRRQAQRVQELVRLQLQQTEAAEAGARAAYRKAQTWMLILGGLALVIGIVVAVIVLRLALRQARSLEHQALYDSLTGLPNRALFFDRLQQAMQACKRDHESFAVVMMDLDRLKETNDSLGHEAGDTLLKHVAQGMSGVLRSTDTLARLGGDEYAMVLRQTSLSSVEPILRKLLRSLEIELKIGDRLVSYGASLGVACCPEHGDDQGILLQKADAAMYSAKHGGGGYTIYNPNVEREAQRDPAFKQALREGIERNELVLYYQPIISVATAQVIAVEALLRWRHPTRGQLGPDDFIPLAEASGLIRPLTSWVLNVALKQSAAWQARGIHLRIGINLSTRNLLDPNFAAQVAELLAATGAKPQSLVFELTESTVMADPERSMGMLSKFTSLGIAVAMDDFGTGYSSLSYLKRLPVHELKIDKSFIRDMAVDSTDAIIVSSTIDLAHNLGLNVIAEGVENSKTWSMLSDMGCDTAQGFYMCDPLPIEELEAWLTTSKWGKLDNAILVERAVQGQAG